MRKGFSLIEMLAVLVVLPIIMVALAGLFNPVITDIPRSYRVIQTNTTLLNMLEQMRNDINTAKSLPESFSQYSANDELLLIETSDGVISYMVMDDKVLRGKIDDLRLLIDNCKSEIESRKLKIERVWSVPHAKVEWRVWKEDGKGYAVQVKTHIEYNIGGHLERKMANSHLFFIGTFSDILR
jgi:prepilin-type N-terminal cleavage/methylation domain-containing protein